MYEAIQLFTTDPQALTQPNTGKYMYHHSTLQHYSNTTSIKSIC